MSSSMEAQKEIEEAALHLLQMADYYWATPGSDRGDESDEETTEDGVQASTTQPDLDAQSPSPDGDKAGNDTTSPQSSSVIVPSPQSATTSGYLYQSVRGVSLTALAAQQQAIQQTRAAMTRQQRAALKLRPYDDLDATGTKVGTLWQTPAERRSYRQTQRRRGANLVRPGTTTGQTFPDRRRGIARGRVSQQ
ncbi:hypothetical protein E4T43_07290 [Aureobasidium subglaciale]|nr:hypothetical protein E4T43_07290 [Aureobasidium subglaciale]